MNRLKRRRKIISLRVNQSDYRLIIDVLEFHHEQLIQLLPEYLQSDFEMESYIAGGCIYTMCNNYEFKDIDFFIRTKGLKDKLLQYFKTLDGLRIELCDSQQLWYGKWKGYELVITNNAISIGDYQIVLKDIGNPESVVGQFDFHHNMFYIENGRLKRLVPLSALEGNELIYNEERARDIVGTIMRVPKFISRGMNIKHRQMAKILLKLHNVGFNENELEVLNSEIMNQSFGS